MGELTVKRDEDIIRVPGSHEKFESDLISKWERFSEGLQHELQKTGVRVTVVSPIMVRTNFFDHPSFDTLPKYSPTSLSPEKVAKAVVKAANSSRLEIIVPSVVRVAVWVKHTFPYFINPIIRSAFRKQIENSKNSKQN